MKMSFTIASQLLPHCFPIASLLFSSSESVLPPHHLIHDAGIALDDLYDLRAHIDVQIVRYELFMFSAYYTVSKKVSGLSGSNASFAHITVTRFSVWDKLMMLCV